MQVSKLGLNNEIYNTYELLSLFEIMGNRVLNYEKGVYLGKKDSKLSEKQITTLKLHTSRQRSY